MSENLVFKILSRCKRTGVQVKKRTYTSLKSFNNYSPDIIQRYSRSYDVECYQLINGSWFRLEGNTALVPPEELTLGEDVVLAVQMDLEDLRRYLDTEIHPNCDYNIYTYLVDKIEAIQGVFDE